jgi:hypothetical protein
MYRKITVNGTVYEYVIGKTHTKVKGVGAWPNTELGHMIIIPDYCECCGESMSELYSSHVDRKAIAVKPMNVAWKIKSVIGFTEEDTLNALVG